MPIVLGSPSEVKQKGIIMNDQAVVEPVSIEEIPGVEIREFIIDENGNEIPVEK